MALSGAMADPPAILIVLPAMGFSRLSDLLRRNTAKILALQAVYFKIFMDTMFFKQLCLKRIVIHSAVIKGEARV